MKAHANDFEGRIREVISDPSNEYIPRVQNAGEIIDHVQVMHNGIKVLVNGYYGEFITKMLQINRGVHEPQEELVFMEVLKYIPDGGCIVELGSYWAFYSMWFYKEVKNAKCFMVEPDSNFLEVGKKNFAINRMIGDFTKAAVGDNDFNIDVFVEEKEIGYINILHADIQGKELQMLKGARETIANRKIGSIFIGTHSQKLHYDCMTFLANNGFEILASADFDNETFCYDGVLVAKEKNIECMQPIVLPSRQSFSDSKITTEIY